MDHFDPQPSAPPRTGLQLAGDAALGATFFALVLAVGFARRAFLATRR